MANTLRAPVPVLVFFALDVGFAIGYLLLHFSGRPRGFGALLDLNLESNLPTWYSSIQWFCVAILVAIFSIHDFSPSRKRSWLPLALPLPFLAMSADEVAAIHEGLGRMSDALLPNGTRESTLFSRTGIWMFLVGAPFVALFTGLILSVRPYLRRSPGALAKLCIGMAFTLGGAFGLEVFYNFVTPGSTGEMIQILAEELCEMVGATIVLWGGWQLLVEHGFVIKRETVAQEAPAIRLAAASRR